MAGIVIVRVEDTGSGEVFIAPLEAILGITAVPGVKHISTTSPHLLLGTVQKAMERVQEMATP